MSARLTRPEDVAYMQRQVKRMVNELEYEGFDRGEIGAVVGGIGLALLCAHNGREAADQIIEGVKLAMDADAASSN